LFSKSEAIIKVIISCERIVISAPSWQVPAALCEVIRFKAVLDDMNNSQF
jgi:hypothetical protein